MSGILRFHTGNGSGLSLGGRMRYEWDDILRAVWGNRSFSSDVGFRGVCGPGRVSRLWGPPAPLPLLGRGVAVWQDFWAILASLGLKSAWTVFRDAASSYGRGGRCQRGMIVENIMFRLANRACSGRFPFRAASQPSPFKEGYEYQAQYCFRHSGVDGPASSLYRGCEAPCGRRTSAR